MALAVTRALVSLVRADALPGLVGAGKDIPGPAIGTPAGHARAFERAADPGARWRRPWAAEESYSHFWRRHLRGKDRYWDAEPASCWPRLVPLRDGPDLTWRGQHAGVDVRVDRYLFPCAAAVVLTLDVTGPIELGALASLATEGRSGNAYQEPGGNPRSLRPTLGRLLEDVPQSVLGRPDPNAVGDPDPLSVTTVVEATGRARDATLVEGRSLHRALHALCTADSSISAGKPALSGSTLRVSSRADGGTLLVDRRARLLWSPRKIFDPARAKELACYHRNLVVATAFTEALLAYMRSLAAGGRRDEVAKHSVNLLGMFYGPAPDIWSSDAIRQQIDDSGQVPTVNQLRHDLAGWSPLKARGVGDAGGTRHR